MIAGHAALRRPRTDVRDGRRLLSGSAGVLERRWRPAARSITPSRRKRVASAAESCSRSRHSRRVSGRARRRTRFESMSPTAASSPKGKWRLWHLPSCHVPFGLLPPILTDQIGAAPAAGSERSRQSGPRPAPAASRRSISFHSGSQLGDHRCCRNSREASRRGDSPEMCACSRATRGIVMPRCRREPPAC